MFISGIDSRPLAQLEQWTKTELDRIHGKWPGSNLTSELSRYSYRPIPQHCGLIPMWVWPLLRINMNVNTDEVAAYLRHSEANARFLVQPSADANIVTEHCERLSEMQTLPARATLYVLDQTKSGPSGENIPIDDWTHPHDQPGLFPFCSLLQPH